ncbi:hypothetical protein EJB05_13631, partial [Eragrostis curvula]
MPDASPPTKATAIRPPQCGRNSLSSPPPFSSQIGPPILFFPVLPIVPYRAMSQAPRGQRMSHLRLRIGFVAAGECKVPNRAQV